MPTTISAARLRSFVTAYIAGVALVTLTFALLNARVAHPWIIGEWLINYTGGFLRRGLLGQLLLLANHLTRLPLVGLAAALQLLLYTAFYLSVLPLLRDIRWSLPLLALLLSPATLAFTVLDPPTSVRKEILLFLALSLLVNAVLFLRPRPWHLALALSIVTPVLLLTHEALLAFLPYLFLPLLLAAPRLRDAARLAAIPILLAAVTSLASMTHPGGRREAEAICRSVGGHLDGQPAGLCNGAIKYLEYTPAQARAETLRAIRFYNYRIRYPLSAADAAHAHADRASLSPTSPRNIWPRHHTAPRRHRPLRRRLAPTLRNRARLGPLARDPRDLPAASLSAAQSPQARRPGRWPSRHRC